MRRKVPAFRHEAWGYQTRSFLSIFWHYILGDFIFTEDSYKFWIYPNTKRENLIQRTFGCCRFLFIFLPSAWSDTNRPENPLHVFSRIVDSTATQASLQFLDTAYQNFFRRVKQGQKPDYPRFKSKNTGHTIRILGKVIQLPKFGFVKCRISRGVKSRILSTTVSQNLSGKYFVVLYGY